MYGNYLALLFAQDMSYFDVSSCFRCFASFGFRLPVCGYDPSAGCQIQACFGKLSNRAHPLDAGFEDDLPLPLLTITG